MKFGGVQKPQTVLKMISNDRQLVTDVRNKKYRTHSAYHMPEAGLQMYSVRSFQVDRRRKIPLDQFLLAGTYNLCLNFLYVTALYNYVRIIGNFKYFMAQRSYFLTLPSIVWLLITHKIHFPAFIFTFCDDDRAYSTPNFSLHGLFQNKKEFYVSFIESSYYSRHMPY